MDEHLGDGNVFAIPDLWKASSLAQLNEPATDSTAFGLEPLCTSSSFMFYEENVAADTSQQIYIMKIMCY